MTCPSCSAPTRVRYTKGGDGAEVVRDRRCGECATSIRTVERVVLVWQKRGPGRPRKVAA